MTNLTSAVTDEITKDIHGEVQWCMLFAYCIVLIIERSPEEVNGRLVEWREAFEGKGLRISRSKIEFDFGRRVHGANRKRQVMEMSDDVVGEVERPQRLGSVLQENCCFVKDMNH